MNDNSEYIQNIENKDKFIKSGEITSQVRELGVGMIKPGAKVVDICDAVEKKIFELGGKPAFPAQISINNIAAHYCPHPNDELVLKEGDMCKLDVGVQVDGFVTDTAATVYLGNDAKYQELCMASKEALENALKIVKPGVKTCEIGKVIQETIQKHGFSPIINLSGHGVGKNKIHGFPTIPNYDTQDNVVLQKGMVIAIEPFATDGKGMVGEGSNATVFMVTAKKPIRSQTTREVFKDIASYDGLPFTTRWLVAKHPAFKVNFALKELIQAGIIKAYAPLPEIKGGIVSQHEHTIFVDDESIVLTR